MKFKAAWNPNLIAFYIESLSRLKIKIKDIGVAFIDAHDEPATFFIEVGDLTVEQIKEIGASPSHCYEMGIRVWEWAIYTKELQITTLRAEYKGAKTKLFFENLERELIALKLRKPQEIA